MLGWARSEGHRRIESAVAMSSEDADVLFGFAQDGDVVVTVAVEVADDEGSGRLDASDDGCGYRREGSRAAGVEVNIELGALENHEIQFSVAVEISERRTVVVENLHRSGILRAE